MADTAAQLVNHVFPITPVRLLVCQFRVVRCYRRASRSRCHNAQLFARWFPVLENCDGGSGGFLLHGVHEESLAVGRNPVLLRRYTLAIRRE
ncbi:MAG: hypothetical protein DMG13_34500 [Acidobacteria bacterium]|nr:MAG: hypothetical protein DMG13_34500 [Acidobacteriota bacterium]